MKTEKNKAAVAQATATANEAPMRQAAYERIEELLNTAALSPGEIVTQRGLVERTGVGLSAVREAIPRLEAEGLLQTLPNRGLMVPSVDVRFVREAYRLRSIIEASAVADAIRNLPKKQIENWITEHENFAVMDTMDVDPKQSQVFQHLDWELHQTLVNAMRNALIENVHRVNAIKIRMAAQQSIRVTPQNIMRVAREHLDFLRPMLTGDEDAAKKALCDHIDNSLRLALGETL